ncbi:unnamed protein product, partial [Nesidiocoris tenuis]
MVLTNLETIMIKSARNTNQNIAIIKWHEGVRTFPPFLELECSSWPYPLPRLA